MAESSLLNPLRFPLFSFFLLSHKVARFLVPFFMILSGVSLALLAPTGRGVPRRGCCRFPRDRNGGALERRPSIASPRFPTGRPVDLPGDLSHDQPRRPPRVVEVHFRTPGCHWQHDRSAWEMRYPPAHRQMNPRLPSDARTGDVNEYVRHCRNSLPDQAPPDVERVIVRMTSELTHRGPDECGYHADSKAALGHRRLSIIDLKSGQQPIYNEDRTVCVVFNGEIYNYQEVRDRLIADGHVFRTNSDTETIVHAYEAWGEMCVEKFRGMFAFAVRDMRNDILFLARDRFGKKPLFYASTMGNSFFRPR